MHIGITCITKVRLIIKTIPLCLLFPAGFTYTCFTVCFYYVDFDASCYLVNELRAFKVVDHVVVAEE